MSISTQSEIRGQFAKAAKEWICESYVVQFRYVARKVADRIEILHAMVWFHPWLDENSDVSLFTFHIRVGDFEIGQEVLPNVALVESSRFLEEALNGKIHLPNLEMQLASSNGVLHHHQGEPKDPWNNVIYMTVSGFGAQPVQFPPGLNDDLRRADIPFDGYTDLLQWLTLNEFQHPGGLPSMAVVVNPPARLADGRVADGELTLIVDVKPAVDPKTVNVAVMGTPPAGVSLRKQLRDQIVWESATTQNRLRGSATVQLPKAHMALVALSIGDTMVQRQWYSDPSMSRNVRFISTQTFDNDLAKVKERLKSSDSRTFEKAVAALAFMSGFAPLLPLNDDAPDIIAITPGGQVVIIECTVKTTDAVQKIGNLVSRREALVSAYAKSSNFNTILSALICKCPRKEIHASDADLAEHDVVLITQEGLERHAQRVQTPTDADRICENAKILLRRLKVRIEK